MVAVAWEDRWQRGKCRLEICFDSNRSGLPPGDRHMYILMDIPDECCMSPMADGETWPLEP